MKKFVLVLFVLILIVSCSRNNNYENISGRELLNELDSKIYTTFNKPVDELIKEEGKPDKIDTLKVANKHTGADDNIYSLEYDDYVLDVYHSVELDKYLLQAVIFKSDDMLEDYNISYGRQKEDYEFLSSCKVQETGDEDKSEVIYAAGTDPGYESLFVFAYENNSLKQVKYSVPID